MSTLIAEDNSGDLADVEFDFVQVTFVLPNRKITAPGDAAVGIAGGSKSQNGGAKWMAGQRMTLSLLFSVSRLLVNHLQGVRHYFEACECQ